MAAAFVMLDLSIRVVLFTGFFRYEILSETQTREAYDEHGMAGVEGRGGSGGPRGMDAADLFAEFFENSTPGMFGFNFGPGANGSSRRRKGQEDVIPYDVTLEDLYNGKAVKMNMEKEVVCGVCKGSVSIFLVATLL